MENQQAQNSGPSDFGVYTFEHKPSERLSAILPNHFDPARESSNDHRDRLFLQILVSLIFNVVALLGVFYFLLPLTEAGQRIGSLLLWGVLGFTVLICVLFLKFGWRALCVNLLLLALSGILFSASFILGGVMSPTMIFLLTIPVVAATLLESRWAFAWTCITLGAWLCIIVFQSYGVVMTRITLEANVGTVQLLSLLGTMLVIMAVLRSYVSANSRLHEVMAEKNQHLDHLATHDSLTNIPNRRAFIDHGHRCLQRAARSGQPFAILVIDLNDFKCINDTLGHKVGDAVLQHFAHLLGEGFRETDFIGRLGGDEFGVILEPVETREGIDVALKRFRESGSKQVEVDGEVIDYDCAVGCAWYPEHGDNLMDLYDAADRAMYGAKRGAPQDFLWK